MPYITPIKSINGKRGIYSQDILQKISVSRTGHKVSAETKRKHSLGNIERYKDPDARKVMSESITKWWQERKAQEVETFL
jgi:hypothetical protein